MSRTVLFVTALTIGIANFAQHAAAIDRYNAQRMTCGQVQAVIAREGAIILDYRSRNPDSPPLYGRYVTNRSFCASGEDATLGTVPTTDAAQCPLLTCVPSSSFEPRRGGGRGGRSNGFGMQ